MQGNFFGKIMLNYLITVGYIKLKKSFDNKFGENNYKTIISITKTINKSKY